MILYTYVYICIYRGLGFRGFGVLVFLGLGFIHNMTKG